MKKLTLAVTVITLYLALFTFSRCSMAVPPFANPSPSDYSTGVTFEEAQKSGKSIVLYFYVNWCHYCKKFTPTLEDLRQIYEDKYSFVFINCDEPENKMLMREYDVTGFPSLFLVDKDKKVRISNSVMGDMSLLRKEFDGFLKK